MDVNLIRTKLKKLSELNPDKVYGYINKPLTIDQVEAFEKEHKITLPPDYRKFITELFDGGVGPDTVQPLKDWNTCYVFDKMDNKLCEPFLLTELSEIYGDDDDENCDDDEEFYPHEDEVLNGTIKICHTGCGTFDVLVVNGAEYGNMWVDGRAADNDVIAPILNDNGERVSFGEWYNSWLDSETKYYENRKERIIEEQKERERLQQLYQYGNDFSSPPPKISRPKAKRKPEKKKEDRSFWTIIKDIWS